MVLPRLALPALGIVLAGAVAAAAEEAKPFDFKPLVPPVFPVPPNSTITSGQVGGAPTTPGNAPPVGNSQTLNPPSPGLRFQIPGPQLVK